MKSIVSLIICFGFLMNLSAQKFCEFNVYFESGSSVLGHQEKAKIDSALSFILDETVFDIKATGHTDKKGSFSFNEDLSQKRANVVVNYIHSKVKNSSIKAEGKSYTDLVYTGDDLTEFEKNRRVNIVLSYSIPTITSLGRETLEPELFFVNNNVDDSVTTKSGTVIHIPANSFQTIDGKEVNGLITISYLEYRDPVDFILGGIPMGHMENNKSFVFNSSGMFTITGKQNEKEIKIKPQKKLIIDFARTQAIDSTNFYNFTNNNQQWNNLNAVPKNSINTFVNNNQFNANQHENSIKESCLFNNCDALAFIGNTGMTLVNKKIPVYHAILKKNRYRDHDVKRLSFRYEKLDQKTKALQKTIDSVSHALNLMRSVYKINKKSIKGDTISFTISCDSCYSNQFEGMENVVWKYHTKNKKQLGLYLNSELEYCGINGIDKNGEANIQYALVVTKRKTLKNVKLANSVDGITLSRMNRTFKNYVNDYKKKRKEINKLLDLRNKNEFIIVKYFKSMDSISTYFKIPFEGLRRDSLACFYDKSTYYMNSAEKNMFELSWFSYFEKHPSEMKERYLPLTNSETLEDTCKAVAVREEILREKLEKEKGFNAAAEYSFKNLKTTLGISSFGVYNCDVLERLQEPIRVLAKYVNEEDEPIQIKSVFMIDHSINSVLIFNGYLDMWPTNFAYSKKAENTLIAFNEAGQSYICSTNMFTNAVNKTDKVKTFKLQKIGNTATKREILAVTE